MRSGSRGLPVSPPQRRTADRLLPSIALPAASPQPRSSGGSAADLRRLPGSTDVDDDPAAVADGGNGSDLQGGKRCTACGISESLSVFMNEGEQRRTSAFTRDRCSRCAQGLEQGKILRKEGRLKRLKGFRDARPDLVRRPDVSKAIEMAVRYPAAAVPWSRGLTSSPATAAAPARTSSAATASSSVCGAAPACCAAARLLVKKHDDAAHPFAFHLSGGGGPAGDLAVSRSCEGATVVFYEGGAGILCCSFRFAEAAGDAGAGAVGDPIANAAGCACDRRGGSRGGSRAG